MVVIEPRRKVIPVAAVINVEIHGEPGVSPALNYAAVEAARLVRQARNELLETSGSVTTDMLADGRMSTANATRQWIHRHRSNGRLITVDEDGRTLIPTFQLNETFDLDEAIADVTKVLTGASMSSWAVWRWYSTHNGWIDDTPLTAIKRDGVSAVAPALAGLTNS